MILAKIVEDPQSGTCLNVSYADITGPVANPNPTGSPFANSPGGQNMQNGSLGSMNNPLSAGIWWCYIVSIDFHFKYSPDDKFWKKTMSPQFLLFL